MEKAKLWEIREHHRRYRAQIEQNGDLLREKKMPALTEEKFELFEKTGNRLIYETDYFERRKFLAVFGLLVAWYQRPEDIRKLEEVIEEICEEQTWALPAHVNRKEAGWQRTVDLFASETGQALAHIRYLAKGLISDSLAEKVKRLVIFRLLDSYMEKPKGQWPWESYYNNWVAVCAGCLGSMALFLLGDEEEKRQAIVERVCEVLPNYISGMLDDGACPEGMGYFTYGMVYYTGFARQLYEQTQGTVNLMDSEKFCKIARFQQIGYLPGGATVSFSDGNRADRFRLGLTCYLAGFVEGVEIPDISAVMDFEWDHCYRFLGSWQDDCWVQEYLEKVWESKKKENSRLVVLPDAQWAVWKTQEIGIALKGGNNGESHNHNDIGSFLMTAKGEVFLADLGCGEYTKEYFQDVTRYEILCNRSMGHSVPIINGKEQKAGKEYKAEYFVDDPDGLIRMSFGGAYEKDAKWKLLRQMKCSQDGRQIEITDRIAGEGVVSIEENLVTQKEPIIEGKRIFLKGERGNVMILPSGFIGLIQVFPEMFRNHQGINEPVWLIRFPVILESGSGSCTMRCIYNEEKI